MGIENGSEIEDAEFRIFVGGLSWGTEERALLDAFQQYGALDAKIVMNRDSGRSRGFGFVTFPDKRSMDDAIDEMHNKELDGRSITVSAARGERSFGGGRGGRGSFGGGDRPGGGGGGECFKCGRNGHWARDCPEGGGGGYGERRSYGDKGGGRGYGGGYGSRGGGGYGDRDSDRYGGGGGGSSDRYGDRGGDKYGSGGRSQSGRDRTRSAPYDRPKDGGFRE